MRDGGRAGPVRVIKWLGFQLLSGAFAIAQGVSASETAEIILGLGIALVSTCTGAGVAASAGNLAFVLVLPVRFRATCLAPRIFRSSLSLYLFKQKYAETLHILPVSISLNLPFLFKLS